MKDHRIRIRLRSPCGTPWRSDTIAGHLAWAAAYRHGRDYMKEFLGPFRKGVPSFVLSDGFPSVTINGALVPLMPAPNILMSGGNGAATDLASYQALKKRKKAQYLTMDQFMAVARGGTVEGDIPENPWVESETLHATISRHSWTTSGEGGDLFQTVDRFLPRDAEIIVYARVREGFESNVEELFCDLAKTGYGRDVSTGMGQFEIVAFEPFDGFAPKGDEDAFIALSTFCPAVDDPVDGRYKVEVRYGKLGQGLENGGNPFKRPLLQILPGAVFRTGDNYKSFHGRLVENIAPGNSDVVQFCHCLPAPCVWPEN